MSKLWTSFKKFLMSHLSARSNLVNFCSTKNLTSNGSKPIRVLTRTKSSCSDDRLPIGYLLRNFQQIWSNFFAPPPPWQDFLSTPASSSLDTADAVILTLGRHTWISMSFIPCPHEIVVGFFRICKLSLGQWNKFALHKSLGIYPVALADFRLSLIGYPIW